VLLGDFSLRLGRFLGLAIVLLQLVEVLDPESFSANVVEFEIFEFVGSDREHDLGLLQLHFFVVVELLDLLPAEVLLCFIWDVESVACIHFVALLAAGMRVQVGVLFTEA